MNHFEGFVTAKKKLMPVLYASVLLFMVNFVITLSKFAVEITHLRLVNPTATLTKSLFITNRRTGALKTDINLLSRYLSELQVMDGQNSSSCNDFQTTYKPRDQIIARSTANDIKLVLMF